MNQNQLLSPKDIVRLGEISRIALREEETNLFCHDLNALLELVSVLETLPQNTERNSTAQRLSTMRDDLVKAENWDPLEYAENTEAGYFSVPSVMEKS